MRTNFHRYGWFAVLMWLMAAAALCDTGTSRPDAHAPIGVMGDHTHHEGEIMWSYRYMIMSMEDNADGTSDRSPEEIATTEPNRFFGLPGQPPTLRVVPTEMTMEMHMLGVMWAPSDRVTLMGMASYIDKEMEHVTFAGPVGTTRLATFTTRASGLGDTRLSALVVLRDSGDLKIHATLGVSLPTGDVEKKARVVAPTGATPELRLPYPMQLGSGTYDPILGLTVVGRHRNWSTGAQWKSTFRVGDNDEGYTLGDEHQLTGWAAYRFSDRWSVSGRASYLDRGNIDGADPSIVAPVQTADPDLQGLARLDLGVGVNFLAGRHRGALELVLPAYQDLDGPQLETDWTVTFGYQLNM